MYDKNNRNTVALNVSGSVEPKITCMLG